MRSDGIDGIPSRSTPSTQINSTVEEPISRSRGHITVCCGIVPGSAWGGDNLSFCDQWKSQVSMISGCLTFPLFAQPPLVIVTSGEDWRCDAITNRPGTRNRPSRRPHPASWVICDQPDRPALQQAQRNAGVGTLHWLADDTNDERSADAAWV